MATSTQPPANLTFQGITVPGSSLNPQAFFAGTRRQRVLQRTIGSGGWAGFGDTDVVSTLRAGILSQYFVKISGSLVVDPGSGTVATTNKWPYGLVRTVFQANGQSNLINADGWFLRLRQLMAEPGLTDRGVPQTVGGVRVTQGTMSLDSESWGVGSATTAIAAGTYDVELLIPVPVSYEQRFLTGAIFVQTLSTTLELNLQWSDLAALFTLTGDATVTFEPQVIIEAEMFTIPSDGQGGMFLPNLSAFHSYIQNRAPNSISAGNNEIMLSGQGVGRQLMKVFWRTQTGTPPAPIIPTATNITSPYWRYGTNTTPETYSDGQDLRYENEGSYGTDIAALQGFLGFDFDKQFAFRDSVDEGSATELRFGYNITTAPTLNLPYAEYVQDVILAGAAA